MRGLGHLRVSFAIGCGRIILLELLATNPLYSTIKTKVNIAEHYPVSHLRVGPREPLPRTAVRPAAFLNATFSKFFDVVRSLLTRARVVASCFLS